MLSKLIKKHSKSPETIIQQKKVSGKVIKQCCKRVSQELYRQNTWQPWDCLLRWQELSSQDLNQLPKAQPQATTGSVKHVPGFREGTVLYTLGPQGKAPKTLTTAYLLQALPNM